jgi:hypothetical protein
MQTFNLTHRPETAPYRKATITHLAFIAVPFVVETQEGPLTIAPDTVDDWEDGYYLAYPADGSKPYAIAPKYVRENYVPAEPTAPPLDVPPPSLGRIVHFVLPDGPHAGQSRAAIITSVHGPKLVNLTVFLDQSGDMGQGKDFQITDRYWSRDYGPDGAPGTWHWPPRA